MTLSGIEPVVPAFASVCSWAVGVFAGCRVDMARGFVAAQLSAVFVSNNVAVGGA